MYWWCLGGIGTGAGFLLVGLRGDVPDAMSFYAAHVFLVIGFSFRSLSLRLELSGNIYRTTLFYLALGSLYFIVFSMMVYADTSEFYRLNWVHAYLVVMS